MYIQRNFNLIQTFTEQAAKQQSGGYPKDYPFHKPAGDSYFRDNSVQNEDRSFFGSLLGKIWSVPTTIVGLAWGIAGLPFGAKVSLGNNAIQFENHPFMDEHGGITIGNVIAYGSGTNPEEIGDHERQHTYQAELLGPFYLPFHLFEGSEALIRDGRWHGPHNDLEKGPMNSNYRNPWKGKP